MKRLIKPAIKIELVILSVSAILYLLTHGGL